MCMYVFKLITNIHQKRYHGGGAREERHGGARLTRDTERKRRVKREQTNSRPLAARLRFDVSNALREGSSCRGGFTENSGFCCVSLLSLN